jgi:hypothetical protein
MRRTLAAGAAVVALAAIPALAAGSQVPITVKPPIAGPSATFAVSFTAPDTTSRTGNTERRYELSATTTLGTRTCVNSVVTLLPFADDGDRLNVTLSPGAGKRWCTGMFQGQVQEIQEPVCASATPPCKALVKLVRTIGTFQFDVRTPGRDRSPPMFAGLKSAFACTPGPQRPGQVTRFHLSWDPATDNVTPSSQIVYDVYESDTQRGEKFSKPTWTTGPGVTAFFTPGLVSHGSFYFVVRARDRAGNEEHNRVERHGVDTCY